MDDESDEDDDEKSYVVGDNWTCPLCDTVNKNTSTECSNEECDMEFADL